MCVCVCIYIYIHIYIYIYISREREREMCGMHDFGVCIVYAVKTNFGALSFVLSNATSEFIGKAIKSEIGVHCLRYQS